MGQLFFCCPSENSANQEENINSHILNRITQIQEKHRHWRKNKHKEPSILKIHNHKNQTFKLNILHHDENNCDIIIEENEGEDEEIEIDVKKINKIIYNDKKIMIINDFSKDLHYTQEIEEINKITRTFRHGNSCVLLPSKLVERINEMKNFFPHDEKVYLKFRLEQNILKGNIKINVFEVKKKVVLIGSTEEKNGDSINFEEGEISLRFNFGCLRKIKVSVSEEGIDILDWIIDLSSIIAAKDNEYRLNSNQFIMIIKTYSEDQIENQLIFSKIQLKLRLTGIENGSLNFKLNQLDEDEKNEIDLVYESDRIAIEKFNVKFDPIVINYDVTKKILDEKLKFNFIVNEKIEFSSNSFSLKDFKENNSEITIKTCNDINPLSLSLEYKEILNKSFFRILSDGLRLDLKIAIDFSENNEILNGNINLHNITGDLNFYESLITSIYNILNPYFITPSIEVFGFGAIIKGFSNQVNQCFNLNFNDEFTEDLSGILEKYHKTLTKVKPSSPSNLFPTIKTVLDSIKKNDKRNNYTILSILTSGNVININETIELLIETSKYPISIVIFGIGKGFFEEMKIFNSNLFLLSFKGRKSIRKNILFESLDLYSGRVDKLTQDILSFVPSQIEEYYRFYSTANDKE